MFHTWLNSIDRRKFVKLSKHKANKFQNNNKNFIFILFQIFIVIVIYYYHDEGFKFHHHYLATYHLIIYISFL